ncbi:hypothetical protein M231_07244 [Tremella mesenterica]|uniref:Uncharacterized protein n=1 Tax=Tremella mesenterica TaxID=5217 RepID=A0A4Q1B9T9_TREME|nr:hypothetical protein M231_07244 [Tremella mesenterica]
MDTASDQLEEIDVVAGSDFGYQIEICKTYMQVSQSLIIDMTARTTQEERAHGIVVRSLTKVSSIVQQSASRRKSFEAHFSQIILDQYPVSKPLNEPGAKRNDLDSIIIKFTPDVMNKSTKNALEARMSDICNQFFDGREIRSLGGAMNHTVTYHGNIKPSKHVLDTLLTLPDCFPLQQDPLDQILFLFPDNTWAPRRAHHTYGSGSGIEVAWYEEGDTISDTDFVPWTWAGHLARFATEKLNASTSDHDEQAASDFDRSQFEKSHWKTSA